VLPRQCQRNAGGQVLNRQQERRVIVGGRSGRAIAVIGTDAEREVSREIVGIGHTQCIAPWRQARNSQPEIGVADAATVEVEEDFVVSPVGVAGVGGEQPFVDDDSRKLELEALDLCIGRVSRGIRRSLPPRYAKEAGVRAVAIKVSPVARIALLFRADTT
jgi:hypothetical protein